MGIQGINKQRLNAVDVIHPFKPPNDEDGSTDAGKSSQGPEVQIGGRIEYYLLSPAAKSTGLFDTICKLLRDPSLTAQVHHLHVDLRAHCHDPHDGYNHDALLGYMNEMGCNKEWKQDIVKGSETALAGLLLTLLPKLKHLEVRLFKQCDSDEAPWTLTSASARKDSAVEILDAFPNVMRGTKVAAEIVYESTHFSTCELFREPLISFDASQIAAFRSLTSISSPTLLPWATMCSPNLKKVEISLDVDNCGRFEFDLPECAKIPEEYTGQCSITSLTAQVPIEFLYTANSYDRIFEYIPTVLRCAPALKHLSLQLKREPDDGPCPGNDIKRSYQTLVRSLRSTSLEELIIDSCDIDANAVRNCPVDFFESLRPIDSLHGLPNLRRIVAPQEAFMRVEGSLRKNTTAGSIAPTSLFPETIETIEIIDSTTALGIWAIEILDAWSPTTAAFKVSTLPHLSKLVLWCDRWYPTLVPDYRTDEWTPKPRGHYPVPGRGGRENSLLSSGLYGEYSGFEEYKPAKTDYALEADMRTGARLEFDQFPDMDDEFSAIGFRKLDLKQKEKMQLHSKVWTMLEKAGIKVETRSDDERGWRK